MTYLIAAAYLAVINLATFFVFRADKLRAMAEMTRVPETHLLMLSFCGGWPSAKLAQATLRHKTQKQPFKALLNGVPAAWALILVLPMIASTLVPAAGEYAAENAVNLSFSGDDAGFNKSETGWMKARSDRETPKFFQSVQD